MPVEVLGIDFGTSNTVAVLASSARPPRVLAIDGNSWMPSAVFVEDDDSLAVGRDAERKARLAPERFEPNPKRRIDDGEILLGVRVVPVVDAVAAVLRRVGEEARRQLGGRNPDQVRLTHPAQWGSARQNVLLAAARAAGFGGSIGLLPEPVGAAAHFASLPGNSLPLGAALAVYDLGGGTFDCAVVGATPGGYAVLAEAGLPDVGGVDFDQTIVDHLGRTAAAADPGRWQSLTHPRTAGDRRSARSLREDVRAAKETLSRYSQADLPLPEPFEDTLLTRREFDGLIRPSIVRTVELLIGTVERAGWTPRRLAGIYLVGGSSRIPLVATVISEKLGVVASTLDQPETSVAMGAAISPATAGPPGRTQSLGPISGPRPPVSGPQIPMPAPRPAQPGPPPPAPARPMDPVTGGHGTSGPARGPQPGPQLQPAASYGAPRPGSVTGPTRLASGSPPSAPTGPPPAPATASTATTPGAGPAGGRRNRLLALGAIAAVVVIAAVTVIILTTRGPKIDAGTSSTTTAPPTSGRSAAASGGQSQTPSGGPTVPRTCDGSSIDAGNGMTPCLLALAGPNEHTALACVPATADPDVRSALGSVQMVTASGCAGLDGGGVDVVYVQLAAVDQAQSVIDSLASTLVADKKSWSSGNGTGSYVAAVTASGPEIYWSYDGLPVIGYAGGDSDAAQAAPTAEELGAFWQRSLLPQPSS